MADTEPFNQPQVLRWSAVLPAGVWLLTVFKRLEMGKMARQRVATSTAPASPGNYLTLGSTLSKY